MRAITKLGQMKQAANPAVPFLVDLLADFSTSSYSVKDPLTRSSGYVDVSRHAAAALGTIGAAAVEPLAQVIKSGADPRVREAAIQALAKTENLKVAPTLISALRDPEWSVERAAAEALAIVHDPERVPPLIEALRTRGQPQVCGRFAG